MEDIDWVVVRGSLSYAEAVLAQGLLESAGIRAEIAGSDLAPYLRPGAAPHRVRLLVPATDVDEANAALPE